MTCCVEEDTKFWYMLCFKLKGWKDRGLLEMFTTWFLQTDMQSSKRKPKTNHIHFPFTATQHAFLCKHICKMRFIYFFLSFHFFSCHRITPFQYSSLHCISITSYNPKLNPTDLSNSKVLFVISLLKFYLNLFACLFL